MKKAFSLLEIIFVIAVLALLSSIALNSNFGFLTNANMTQTKAEIALIRSSLNSNKNRRIIQGLTPYPTLLDLAKNNTENEMLFAGTQEETLLTHPLMATTTIKKEAGKFAKISSTQYWVYIDKENYIEFVYDKDKGTFGCDYENALCKELD